MFIKVIENESDFLLLKNDWDRLAHNLITVNKFDWAYKWWKHNSKGNNLKILVCEKDNRIVGIAPLYIKNIKPMLVLNFKKVCFIGGRISDYLDFLIEQDQDREIIFESFLNYISENISFDVLELRQINSDYPNFDLWQKYTDTLNMELKSFKECPKAKLSNFQSYEDYFSQLSKNHKKSIKLRQNKIKKETKNVEFVFKKDINEEDIRIVGNINIKRQEYLYKKGIKDRFCHFTDQIESEFIKDFFCSTDIKSKFLSYLKCNGTIISYILFLSDKKYLSYWNTGFDPDYEIYSPTKLLINESIKYAFDNGYEYFDFLRGNDSYKLDWTNEQSTNYNLKKNYSLKANIGYSFKNLIQARLIDNIKPLIKHKTPDSLSPS